MIINNDTSTDNDNSNKLVVIKPKKKISCTVCRLKKIKCDGNKPFCQQCDKRGIQNQCAYVKLGQVGRPPKNSVVNKLVLNRAKQTNNMNSIHKEFIFENVVYTIHTDSKFINNDKNTNLYSLLNTFANYENPLQQVAVYRAKKALPHMPEIKMYNILELYSWSTGEVINAFILKMSSISLQMFIYHEPVLSYFFQQMMYQFCNEPIPSPPRQNPMTNLSSEKAVELIELFFAIHPHSIVLNKTLILQGYWTEAIDPILLCVIFGTATYFSRLLEGKHVGAWHAVNREIRNPFLDYAYFLLYKATSEATLSKFQALTLLGLFESTFGYPKRGVTTLALATLVGKKIGILDGSYEKRFSELENELISITVWLTINCIIRGAIDLGQIPDLGSYQLETKLPPPSIERSLSYQFELNNGYRISNENHDYLVESFYMLTVITKFIAKLMIELPNVKYNLNEPDKGPAIISGIPKVHDLIPRFNAVLKEFSDFIQNNRDAWSKRQTYIIESACLLLEMHIIFIKNFEDLPEGINFTNSSFDIFYNTVVSYDDPAIMEKVQQAIPLVYKILDNTLELLNDEMNNEKVLLIPKGIISSLLESSWEILLLKTQSDPLDVLPQHYLSTVEEVVEKDIWKDWTEIAMFRAKIENYKNNNNLSSALPSSFSSNVSMKLINSLDASASIDPSTALFNFTTEDQLAMASFFDPCARWLNPLENLPINMMLVNDNYNNSNNNNLSITTNPHVINNTSNYMTSTNNINSGNTYDLPISSITELHDGNVPEIIVETANNISVLDFDLPSYSLSPSLSPPHILNNNDTICFSDNGNNNNNTINNTLFDNNIPSPMTQNPSKLVNSLSTPPDIQSILFDEDPFIT
ncbi:hypothetical protein BJ944DRAFT_236403 [Cunninghamella echinulata]|nr:hypothetical protein BJ944DRAFT_236403 [Cunninghamella echinulata]